MKKTLFASAFFFALAAVAFPQVDAVRLKFTAVASTALSGIVYKTYPEGLEQPPVFATMNTIAIGFSEPFTYTGPGTLAFYKEPVTAESKPIASFNAASLKNGCVFVFYQVLENGVEEPVLRVVPLNDMLRQCPENHIVFYNFTRVPLAGMLGGTVFRPLPPKTPPLPIKDAFRVDMYSIWQQENRIMPVSATTLGLNRGSRYFGMFYPEIKRARDSAPRVRFRLIVDVVDVKLDSERMIEMTTSD